MDVGDALASLLDSLGIAQLNGADGETGPSAVNVRISSSRACGRGLVAARSLRQGDVAIAVPLRCARTVSKSHASLRSARKGALGTLLGDLDATLAACGRLLPGDTRNVLVMALGLLAELRDPKSAAQATLRMLPAPPRSPLAAVCADGQPATDLLMFSDRELAQLQCPPLEAVITRERLRLASLHSLLFPGPQPAVSLASFIWAHCLVRSRALDLQMAHSADATAKPGGSSGTAQLSLCMIPLLDLANHRSGPNATCTIRLHVRAGGNSTVELVAVRSVPRGGELSLSYGDRPLRDFLRGYAFTPNDTSFEVFEDFGGRHEALIVRNAATCHDTGAASAPADSQPTASTAVTRHSAADVAAGQEREAAAAAAAGSGLACSTATMVLQGVRVLSTPGAHSLLDFGGATVCYSVGNTPEHGNQYGPGLVVQCTCAPSGTELGSCRSDQPATQQDAAGKPEEDTGARPRDGGQLPEARHERPPARLEACVEAALCWRVARDAQALLSSFPTSIEDDQALLRRAGPEPDVASAAHLESAASWSAWTHMQLALRYRLARKHLLQGIVSDLECQARMVSDGSATERPYA